jgi:hypothetical protein
MNTRLYFNGAPGALRFKIGQFEALAYVIAELDLEFDERIERTKQQLLNTMVRLAMPGERAEQTAYAVETRLTCLEGRLEPKPKSGSHLSLSGDRSRNGIAAALRVLCGRG